MPKTTNRVFVARTIYHHAQRTHEHATLLVYKDAADVFELFDDREDEHDSWAGSKDDVLEEWEKRNRQLIKDGFLRDDLRGEPEWQRFIS